MTRVNTLNEIADIYRSGSEIIQENETVGKMKADLSCEKFNIRLEHCNSYRSWR